MKVLKNLNDLAKYVSNAQGLESVVSEQLLKKELKKAANQLEGYLKDELNKYFSSYTPSVYVRTGDTLKSIYVTEPRRLGVGLWGIDIKFSDIGYKPSVMSGNHPDGFTPRLISTGWNVSGKIGKTIPMFSTHPGTDYIPKAVERFNKNNKFGFKVQILGLE